MVKKEEYERIKHLQLEESVKAHYAKNLLKPYNLQYANPMENGSILNDYEKKLKDKTK